MKEGGRETERDRDRGREREREKQMLQVDQSARPRCATPCNNDTVGNVEVAGRADDSTSVTLHGLGKGGHIVQTRFTL